MSRWTDAYIGSLRTGEYIQSFATPGEHAVKVQPHFLSFPDGTPATVTIGAEPGNSYYIRFSQHVDDIIIIGSNGMVLGHLELQLVPVEVWEKKL